MRIRSTKPEFWRSKTIAALEWDVRLVLKGLESYVDDNGVGKDDIALIAADVFPRDLYVDPPETLRRIAAAISKLADAGLIVRYTYDGEDLVYVHQWKKIQYVQNPNKGRFPRPDGTLEYVETVDTESYRRPSGDPPETLRTGTEEQRNRGTGKSLTLVEGVQGETRNRTRGTRLPNGWMPNSDVVAQMRSDHPRVDLKSEHAKFIDYWQGKAGKDARKADWNATWRNWIRRAAESHGSPNGGRLQGADLKASQFQAMKDEP